MLSETMTRQGAFLFRWRSYLPLLLAPAFIIAGLQYTYPFGLETLDVPRELICMAVAVLGLVLRAITVGYAPRGTSGRNTTSIKADALNTTGMYSVTRHPLYLANFIIFFAVLMDMGSWWLLPVGTLAYWIYYERIMLIEERFLLTHYGDAFAEWSDRTPAVLPRWRQWQSPSQPFCVKRVIRSEYNTVFMVAAVFTAIEVGGDFVLTGTLEIEPGWLVFLTINAAVFLAIRTLKKWTNVLTLPAREETPAVALVQVEE